MFNYVVVFLSCLWAWSNGVTMWIRTNTSYRTNIISMKHDFIDFMKSYNIMLYMTLATVNTFMFSLQAKQANHLICIKTQTLWQNCLDMPMDEHFIHSCTCIYIINNRGNIARWPHNLRTSSTSYKYIEFVQFATIKSIMHTLRLQH